MCIILHLTSRHHRNVLLLFGVLYVLSSHPRCISHYRLVSQFTPQETLSLSKARYTLSVFRSRVHGPYTGREQGAVNTGGKM